MPTAEIDVTDVEITLSFRSDLLQTTRSILGRRLLNVLRIAPRVCPIMHSRERYIAYSSSL